MKIGDPVRFACPEVILVKYLHKEHIAVITPNALSVQAIENNIVWDSKMYVSGNLLGYEYAEYEDGVIVEKYSGIDYLQKLNPNTGLYVFDRIKSRKPLVTEKSFEECALPLYDIIQDIKKEKVFKTSHLSGIYYDDCEDPEKVWVQSNQALIYSINRRYIIPL